MYGALGPLGKNSEASHPMGAVAGGDEVAAPWWPLSPHSPWLVFAQLRVEPRGRSDPA